MELTPAIKVALILNNYFHDVATAVLLSSAVVMWVVGSRARVDGLDALRWFASMYPALSKLALGAIVWIIVGGIPRMIFFAQLEWDPALAGGLVPALTVKHLIFVAVIGAGAAMWLRMRSMVRDLLG